jgi:large subunit ribosomal protein L19
MSTVIDTLEKQELKKRPSFAAGDRVRVHFQVIEGSRKRTQVFEGIVIKRQGSGARETFTVRKNSFGVGVERTFPLHSPKIEKLEVAARGDVRRAKLYYLREKVGRSARVAERRWGIEDDQLVASDEAQAVDAEGVAQEEVAPEATDDEDEGGTEAEGQPEADQPADEQAEEPAADEQQAEEPAAEQQQPPAEGSQPEADAADEAEPTDAERAPDGDGEASSEKAEG